MRFAIAFLGLMLIAQPACAQKAPSSPVFVCGDAKEWEAFNGCIEKRVDSLNAAKSPAPKYDVAAGAYFYQRLRELPPGESENPEDTATYTRRGQIGEWLYFSMPEFVEENGVPPHNYANITPLSMTDVKYFPLAGKDLMVIFWLYNAASQSAYQAVVLHPDGSITPMQAESYNEEDGLTTGTAYFNNFSYDPETHTAHDGSRSGWTWYESDYLLDGTVFRLQKLTQLESEGDEIASKETVLYNRKKKR